MSPSQPFRLRRVLPVVSALVLALVVGGCESNLSTAGTPVTPAQGATAGLRAILAPGPAGQTVTIDNPASLPEAVRAAADLKVAFTGGLTVPVTRSPGGSYSFIIPSTARTVQDVAGNLKIIFVMNDRASQIVTLSTGSPVQFATPPVLAQPAGGTVVRGLDVKLTANTAASSDQYQFTWSSSGTGGPPWLPIPGQGKEVTWTPPAPGNFFIKVDAVDIATQQAYSTTTPSALVFVTDGKDVITTEPTSGTIERGTPVSLVFNRPAGLTGEELGQTWSYGPSQAGPWTAIQGGGARTSWLPTAVGSSFIKTEVVNRQTGTINTFVSPTAVVFVNEGRPIVSAVPQSVERGDRVALSLNIANPGSGPFTWYYARAGGVGGAPNWTLVPGNGANIDYVVNEAGSFHFRVDVPNPGGSIKTFTTTDPVLNVFESERLISTVSPHEVINAGGSVTFSLKARGIPDTGYKFVWYVSQNPLAGWSILPAEVVADLYRKDYRWKTTSVQPAGSYFVRVDATELTGTTTYTFTSSAPVVTVER